MSRCTWLLPVLVQSAALALSPQERAEGFASLFGARDLTGWIVAGAPEGWSAANGTIHSDGGKGGALLQTEQEFGNFILRLEWYLSRTGNSGVFLRGANGGGGYEIQLLAPWTPHRDDLHCTGSLYGYAPVDPRPDETTQRWRDMEIVCMGERVTISVDGRICCQADLNLIPELKSAPTRGRIGLQDSHTGPGEFVEFRNIRVKDLDRDPLYVMGGLWSSDPAKRAEAMPRVVALGAATVPLLLDTIGQESPQSTPVARRTLEQLVAHASRPGAGQERDAVAAALSDGLAKGEDGSRAAAARLLAWLADAPGAIHALRQALHDPATRSAALAALTIAPVPAAGDALVAELSDSPSVDLIDAVGERREAGAVGPLLPVAAAGPSERRAAAARVLGYLGDARAARVLSEGARSPDGAVRSASVRALLDLAAAQRERDPMLARELAARALQYAGPAAAQVQAMAERILR